MDLILLKETDTEIDTNIRTSTKGASQIVGLGIGTSITGKHGDIIVTDDIVNLKDRISRAEREKTKIQYMELQILKTETADSLIQEPLGTKKTLFPSCRMLKNMTVTQPDLLKEISWRN